MRVLVLYRDRSSGWGGTERVLSAFVRVFKEEGHYVKVLSFDGAWDPRFMGEPPDSIERIRIRPSFVERFLNLNGRVARRLMGIEALILTYSLWAGSFDYVVDAAYNDLRGSPDIGYVHYPTRRSCDAGFRLGYLPSYILEYIFKPRADHVLTNSTWTLGLIRKCGVNGIVVHPPVEPIECDGIEKENLVIGLGRLSKPWEEFIGIAKAVKAVRGDIKFVIAGYASSEDRVEELRALARDSVMIMPNIGEDFKRELLCRAKAILHTHPAEHFGIAIVEAMSTGAVPIVHRDGGAWFDIVEEGRYGYGYDTINEAVEAVINAVSMGSEERQEIRQKAMQYTYENFKQRLLSIIKGI